MNFCIKEYIKAAQILKEAKGGDFSPGSNAFIRWLSHLKIPGELIAAFRSLSPKTECWLGAGTLFDEKRIMQWNELWPEALQERLLIVGSASNGDHIVVDLLNGDVGFLCHELDWQQEGARKWYIAISPSLSRYLYEVNTGRSSYPHDYFEAVEQKNN